MFKLINRNRHWNKKRNVKQTGNSSFGDFIVGARRKQTSSYYHQWDVSQTNGKQETDRHGRLKQTES